jgi:hypothetical protein
MRSMTFIASFKQKYLIYFIVCASVAVYDPTHVRAADSEGTVSISAKQSNGNSLSPDEINAVILFNIDLAPGQLEVARRLNPYSNPISFSHIAYGNLFADVYCWDMLAGRSEVFQHTSPWMQKDVSTVPKRPLAVTVYHADRVTVLSNADVHLDSWNGEHRVWSVDRTTRIANSSGYTFINAWPTTLSNEGEKYRIRILHNGIQVGLQDPVILANSSSGSTYSIITTVPAPPSCSIYNCEVSPSRVIRGEDVDITWSSTNCGSNVHLEAYRNGEYCEDIGRVRNDGHKSWAADPGCSEGTYQIKVTDDDDSSNYCWTADFTIDPLPCNLSSGNISQARAYRGRTLNVSWDTSYCSSEVDITLLLIDPSDPNASIPCETYRVPNSGSFSWPVENDLCQRPVQVPNRR